MQDIITPGQTKYRPFTLAETPDSPPTVAGVYQDSGGVFAAIAGTVPSVVNVSGLAYYAAFTPPAEAETEDEFWVLLNVTIGGTTSPKWLYGGFVDVRPHGLTAGQQAQLDAIESRASRIGSGSMSVRSAITAGADLKIVRGDSYGVGASNPALQWIDESDIWPDLSTAESITFTVRERRPIKGPDQAIVLEVTDQAKFSVSTVDGHQAVDLVLDASVTATAKPGRDHEYDVQATWSDGRVATFVGPGALCNICPDQTLAS